jgi:hypothetical protein
MRGKQDPYIRIGRTIVDELLAANSHRSHEITAGIDGERFHTQDVHDLVRLLSHGKASAALQIAAIGHDIERFTVPGKGGGYQGKRSGPAYEAYKKNHAAEGGRIMAEELIKRTVPKKLAARVQFLISHHDDTIREVEAIGDEELDILVAADTLSFLNSFAYNWLNGVEHSGPEGLADKLQFMLRKLPQKFWSVIPKIELQHPEVLPYLKEQMAAVARERGFAQTTL